MDILQLLLNTVGAKDTVSTLTEKVGADKSQVQSAMEMIIPTLLSSMNKNVQSSTGLESLMGALDQHAEDNVQDTSNFLGGFDLQDGMKILGHLLGNSNTQTVTKNVAKNTGLSTNQTADLMGSVASMLMGLLGNQKANGALTSETLPKALAKTTKSNDLLAIATSLLDQDGDGNIIDDLGNMLGNFLNKK